MTQFATDLAIAIIIGNTVSALLIGLVTGILRFWLVRVQTRKLSEALLKINDTRAMETDVNKH